MDQQHTTQPWVNLYRSALLELDYKKLAERLKLAASAIQTRMETLSSAPDHSEEIRALRDAQQNLRVLQREINGSAPDPNSPPPLPHHHPEISGEYVVFVDPDRRYVEVSDGVCRLLGFSREEFLRKTIDDITAPELVQDVNSKFQQYVADGSLQGEFVLMAKDGTRVPIRYHSRVFPDGCLVATWFPLEEEG